MSCENKQPMSLKSKESMHLHVVSDEESGRRIDHFFIKDKKISPQSLIAKYLRKGLIRLDGRRTSLSQRLLPGQRLTYPKSLDNLRRNEAPSPQPRSLAPSVVKAIRSWILMETKDFVVLNKPAGIACQGGTKQRSSLDSLLKMYFAPRQIIPRLVHRLDKATSGVLVVALSKSCAQELAKFFRTGHVEKIYQAILYGTLPKPQGKIDLPLYKDKEAKFEKMTYQEGGKAALTYYTVLQAHGPLSYAQLEPRTGRTHQLRVHLREMNAPILGDTKYGRCREFMRANHLPNHLYLHAARLQFQWENRTEIFHAPLPIYFTDTLEKFSFLT